MKTFHELNEDGVLTAEKVRLAFEKDCRAFIEVIDKHDKATPGNESMVEPKWWLQMMEIRRECQAFLDKKYLQTR